jgi:hypothetical protein
VGAQVIVYPDNKLKDKAAVKLRIKPGANAPQDSAQHGG